MTIRKRETRDGTSRLFIEIRYRTVDGRKVRFRRDASVQTRMAARAEERRLLAELERTGTLESGSQLATVVEPQSCTFADAVRHYRETRMATLKQSTRDTYNGWLDRLLISRFGGLELESPWSDAMTKLDAELIGDGVSPSARRNIQIATRVVLRAAVSSGRLALMPRLPALPKVGRKAPNPMYRADLEGILACASPAARFASYLSAFAGLRRGEVVGLRWSDVDLKGNSISVRRAIVRGVETTPKSGEPRVIPIATPLRVLLESSSATKKNPWAPVATTAKKQLWGETGLNQAFKRAQKRAGRGGWCFHDLRHFFISELFRLGVPAPVVQMLAGHEDLETTQRYADVAASDLARAIALFEGNNGATAETRDTAKPKKSAKS